MQLALLAGGERTDKCHAIDLIVGNAGQVECSGDGLSWKLARPHLARDLFLLDCCGKRAVFQDSAGGVIEEAAESENDHAMSPKTNTGPEACATRISNPDRLRRFSIIVSTSSRFLPKCRAARPSD